MDRLDELKLRLGIAGGVVSYYLAADARMETEYVTFE